MFRFRPITALLLSLLMMLTAQSMALVRAQSGPSGLMVLCTGTGAETILVDETGAPAAPAHLCPDCVLALAMAPQRTAPERHSVDSRKMPRPALRLLHARSDILRPFARGPPLL